MHPVIGLVDEAFCFEHGKEIVGHVGDVERAVLESAAGPVTPGVEQEHPVRLGQSLAEWPEGAFVREGRVQQHHHVGGVRTIDFIGEAGKIVLGEAGDSHVVNWSFAKWDCDRLAR
jgi:hypothetical protein